MENNHDPLYFLGPKSENRPFLMDTISLLLNDYIFWRRNFHPMDPTVLSFSETQSLKNQDFRENFTNELFKLLADLKLDPPFFSPRYMAHMISENALPGLVAYMATLMYNPNNVSSEASPVTIKYELEVGRQLATLFGFDPKKSFGHITGGGTVANYQSVFYNMHIRFIPISLAMTLVQNNIDLPKSWNTWNLINTHYDDYPQILKEYKSLCEKNNINYYSYEKNLIAALGLRSFERKYRELFNEEFPEIKIIIPATGHYSWSRSAKLHGLGTENLIKVKLNSDFQISTKELDKVIKEQIKQKNIVLQLVGVYGTTEFGSFDQIHSIVELRDKYVNDIYIPIHIDAAYGGYYSSLFHGEKPKNTLKFEDRLRQKHDALASCDSITVDPHKLGSAPYGAGAFLFRHGDLKEFVAENAEYCFNPKSQDSTVDFELGKYILEGSKPGASATAVYFNHKLIPLNYDGYGRILEKLSLIAINFHKLLNIYSNSDIELVSLNDPQANIVCFYVKTKQIEKITDINRLTSKIAARFGVKKIDNIQEYDYIVSNTTINLDTLSELPSEFKNLDIDTNKVTLIRMVFMNQWHEKLNSKGETYLEHFLETLVDYTKNLVNNSTY